MLRACLGILLIFITDLLAAETTRTAVEDYLTTAGRQMWSIENLGPQIRHVNIMGGALGTLPDNTPVVYAVLMGEPARFVIFDGNTGALLKNLPMPGADGAYDVHVSAAGPVYISSHPLGNFYRYTPNAEFVEQLKKPIAEVTFIWDLCESPDGKIYGACYPKSRVFEFDPATSITRDLGPAKVGEDYARTIVYDRQRKKLFVGVGSHAALVELDPRSGKRRNILPAEYKGQTFVYSIGVHGDQLLLRMDPLNKTLVLNPDTGKVTAELPYMNSNTSQEVDGISYYTSGNALVRYTAGNTVEPVPGVNRSGGRGFGMTRTPDGNSTEVRIITGSGDLLIYNPTQSSGKVVKCAAPGQPIQIHNIARGPDEKIYSSGYVVGHLGVFDPRDNSHTQLGGVKQAEGITNIGSTLYFGTYPHAIISSLDTAAPVKRGNPRELFRLHDKQQDRPFGMLGLATEKKVFVGTVPGYGLLGGALTIYDPVSSTTNTYRDIIPKQSLVNFAYRDGLVYGGTTIYGGLGIEPTEKEGKLFIWDVAKGEKIFETVPVPGRRVVHSLQFSDDGKLWGWGEGELFIFDTQLRRTIYSQEKMATTQKPKHFWRGGHMLEPVNGVFHGILQGKIYRIDAQTRDLEILAQGSLELLTRDTSGRLYFVNGSELGRLVPKSAPD